MLRGIYLPRSMDAGAFAITTYGIPLLVLATTGSAALTGLAFALEWIPRLGAFGVAGALVDRHGTTRTFRCASAARALVAIAAAFLLPQHSGHLTATVIVMVLAATTGALTEVSYIAAETAGGVASRSAGENAHRVQSVLLGIDQVATLAGPAVAGVLLQWAGAAGMLSAIAGFSLLATLLPPRPYADQHRDDQSAAIAQGLRAGWQTLRSLPTLGWLVAGLTVSNAAVGVLQAAAPVIVVQHLGHSTADAGLIWTAAAATTLLAVAVCRRAIDRFGLWPVGTTSAAIAATACLAVSFADTYSAFLTLTAVLMAGEGGLTVVLRTLRARLIPPEVFGSTLSLTILVLLLPFPIAGLLIAAVPPALLSHALTGCAVLQALGLALAFTRLRTDPALRARGA